MKIIDVKTYLLRLDFRFKIGAMPPIQASGVFINIKTDEDIDGWGLAHFNLSNMAQKTFIDEALSRILINQDPFMIEEIFHKIYHSSNRITYGISHSTSAIQVALWDIIGKKVKQPIYRLLGGMKTKVRAYASMPRGYKPKAAIGAVQSAIDLGGFTGVKLRVGGRGGNPDAIVKEVRDAFPNLHIIVDANSHYLTVAEALKFAKVCGKNEIEWLEEPMPSDNLNGLAKLRSEAPCDIAGGENDFGIFRFEDILSRGSYDIVQPDVTRSGGFLQCKKIDAMAEVKGVRCIPHIFGFGLSLVANLHFILSTRCDWLEFPFYPEEFQILEEPIKVENGVVKAIEKPGLGVEINKKTFEENVVI
ncbi:MAG: mandelate racemase/muconate lactonizing enzyme family protein [Candidatus Hodarchaeota archaeon]